MWDRYINAAALHGQSVGRSVSQSSTDLTISDFCTVQTVVTQDCHCSCPSCPPELGNPGFDSPLLVLGRPFEKFTCSRLLRLGGPAPARCLPARPRAKALAALYFVRPVCPLLA